MCIIIIFAGQVTWYRKHFNLPVEWKDAAVWIYFQGIFRAATVFLNGRELTYHDSGYTSFAVDLSAKDGALFGNGKENENVLSIRSQSFGNSGHWYEGGGLYRHNFLVKAEPVHIVPDGVLASFVFPGTSGDRASASSFVRFHDEDSFDGGQFVDKALLNVRAAVVNGNTGNGSVGVQCTFVLVDEDEKEVAQVTSNITWIQPRQTADIIAEVPVSKVELWSPARTYLYRVRVIVSTKTDPASDVLNDTTVGARLTHWSADDGFFLNGEPFKWRGFCDHNDFTGVGAAVPERINLFRAQSLRAVGGNSRRMSHNPPIPSFLDILDRVGVLVWNENRNFGHYEQWSNDMRDFVQRDRNHPSVMLWSFCNEGGCVADSPDIASVGGTFRAVAKSMDPFRPVTGNMVARDPSAIGSPLSDILDVQGFSHMQGDVFDAYHEIYPEKPLINSECCSCVTQRGEDVPDKEKAILGNFNADCTSEQTARGLTRKFVAGSLVWTLFDYYGEPSPYNWPMVSSSFGSIDLAGFSKAAAFWYRAWWLYNTTNSSSGPLDNPRRTAPYLLDPEKLPDEQAAKDSSGFLVHIVQHWEPDVGGPSRTIQVYSNAMSVSLAVNGKQLGVRRMTWLGWAEWTNVTYSAGNLTAHALSEAGEILARHTVVTAGTASSVVLTLDVPNEATSTGSALLADGQDAALVRAMVVDSGGTVVSLSSHNITFKVISGPGRIIGVGNGNPSCHEPNKAAWRSAYHGLARAVVQVTVNAASSDSERRRLQQIDAESGQTTTIFPPGQDFTDTSIVVEASAENLVPGRVSIPVSSDAAIHSVLAVAKKSLER